MLKVNTKTNNWEKASASKRHVRVCVLPLRNWVFPLNKTTFWLHATVHKFHTPPSAPPVHLHCWTTVIPLFYNRFCDHIIAMIERKKTTKWHRHHKIKENTQKRTQFNEFWTNFHLTDEQKKRFSLHSQMESVFADTVFKQHDFFSSPFLFNRCDFVSVPSTALWMWMCN